MIEIKAEYAQPNSNVHGEGKKEKNANGIEQTLPMTLQHVENKHSKGGVIGFTGRPF